MSLPVELSRALARLLAVIAVGAAVLAATPPAAHALGAMPPNCADPTEGQFQFANCVVTKPVMFGASGFVKHKATRYIDMNVTVDAEGMARGSVELYADPTHSNPCERVEGSPNPHDFANAPCLGGISESFIRRYVHGSQYAIRYRDVYPDDPASNTSASLPGGFTKKRTGVGRMRLDMALPALLFQADTYFMTGFSEVYFDAPPAGWPGSIFQMQNTYTEWVVRVKKQSLGLPTATCQWALDPTTPGKVRFTSTATDPSGLQPFARWTFSDGTSAEGTIAYKTFTTPGMNTATLTVTGPDGTDTRECNPTIPKPELRVDISTPDGLPPFPENEPIHVRVKVSARGNSPGTLTGI